MITARLRTSLPSSSPMTYSPPESASALAGLPYTNCVPNVQACWYARQASSTPLTPHGKPG